MKESFHRRTILEASSIVSATFLLLGLVAAIRQLRRVLRDLRRAQELSPTQESWLQPVQDVGNIGLWEIGGNPDYACCSAYELNLLGLPPDTSKLSYSQFLEMVRPKDRALTLVNTVGPERGFEREFRISRVSGEERWILARGTTFRYPEQRWESVGVT